LHDSVKQQLFSITLSAATALNLLSIDPEATRSYLEHLKRSSREAQAEMTGLLQELVPVPLQENHLNEALERYTRQLGTVHHLQVVWSSSGTNCLSIAQEHVLFRAAQEAIANVIRHSGASSVKINLDFGPETILTIADDGHGFDPEAVLPGSTGLATMRNRLERVDGAVWVYSQIGKGTQVEIRIPFQGEKLRRSHKEDHEQIPRNADPNSDRG
ncbi:MAG: sensor histidine kinase, partial [Chloroflexota bacterium]